MTIHASFFPDNWPNNEAILVHFDPEVFCLRVGDGVTFHLGEGTDQEPLYQSLLTAADALRQHIDKQTLTPAELAPAGTSEQDGDIPW